MSAIKTLTTAPKPKLPPAQLVFGQTFSDHMLTINYNAASTPVWETPEIKPYGKISLDPSCTVFHYGVSCFEGMKAYVDANNRIRLFRPDMNMTRFQGSCQRLGMKAYDKDELLELIKELVRTEKEWIPRQKGYSLYIRPTAIATQASLGVGMSKQSMIMVMCSPVGPYYKTGFSAVSLYAGGGFVRGTGDAKVGGNYAPGIVPQIIANEKGYQQVLWLFGEEDYITEVGTMNFFAYLRNEQGVDTLVTPPLDGTILPGVTRDSIIKLATQWGISVEERLITMGELCKSITESRVHEVFGAGDPLDASKQAGPLTTRFADSIMDIQYGVIEHEWSVIID